MNEEEIRQLNEAFMKLGKIIHQQSHQKFESLKLYPGQPKFLALIKRNEGVTQKELARMHCVKPATITGMLYKLEAGHYVYRVPDDADKRIMRVYLTEEGLKLAEESEKYIKTLTKRLFSDFTDDEIRCFIRLTNKMQNNLIKEEK